MSKIPFQRLALAGFLIASVFPVMAQTTDAWKTEEYYRSGGLDLINAAEAYAAGYTGQGIRIGIVDTGVEPEHDELSGKVEVIPVLRKGSEYFGPAYYEDELVGSHGTHVGGIAAAKRDGQRMHGVAFDADLTSMIYKSNFDDNDYVIEENRRRFRSMLSDPNLRVINNSWQYMVDVPRNANSEDYYGYFVDSDPKHRRWTLAVFDELVRAAREDGKVIVFAAANEGRLSATHNLLSYFDPTIQSFLTVTAVNAGGASKNNKGEVVLSPEGLPYYTNRAGIETSLYTLAAPGSNILAPNAFITDGLKSQSGTSMAAPHVSGAVAVVAQAFPWMTGKQLADTVLTTTDRIILPEFAVQYEESMKGYAIKIIIDRDKNIDLRQTLTKENLRRTIESQLPGEEDRRILEAILDDIDKLFDEKGSDPNLWGDVIIKTTSEEVFGQGMLNLGHAVKGIGKIDINRLSAENVRKLRGEDGRLYQGAVETFNTKGFSAQFSNDIDERRWDDKYHHADFQTGSLSGKNGDALALNGLGGGLEKTGEGLLTLSGTNTYTGPTIVSGGRLSVSKREDGTGGILTTSHVFVTSEGILQGNGTIKETVHNNGIVAPGNSIGTLTVGDYRAGVNGILSMEFNPEGEHDRLAVTGTAYLGGELQLIPQQGFYQVGNGFTFQLIEGQTEGDFENLTVNPQSPVLSFDVTQTNAGLTLKPERKADAYARYASNTGAARLGNALLRLSEKAESKTADLIASIDFSDPSGRDITIALKTMHPEVYDVGTMAEWDTLSDFNQGAIKRALSQEPTAEGFRFSMIGDVRRRHGHNGFTGWRSEEKGIELAWTSAVAEGLTMTGDASLLQRDADLSHGLSGKVESTAAYAGLSVKYEPVALRGATVFGALRLGLSDNDLTRTVLFPGQAEKVESDWTGVSGSFMAGADWHWENDSWRVGPVVWSEVVTAHREDVCEQTASAAGLRLDGQTFTRTTVNVGLHVGGEAVNGRSSFATDLYLTRRENVSDNRVESRAAFMGSDVGFKSSTDHAARDAWVLEVGTSITTPTLTVSVSGAAEISETGGADSSANIKMTHFFH